MNIAELLRKIAWLVRRKQYDNDLAEEMAFHREQAARDFEQAGLSAADARNAAARQFGNAARLKEQSIETVGFRWETAWQDLRYALRQLRNNPGFACTAILILGLGIGAATAIFSAVNPILFASLPYPDARNLLSVYESGNDGSPRLINFADYVGLSQRSHSLEMLAALRPWQPTITGGEQPERLEGQRVGAAYFRVLGSAPAVGRDFQSADDVVRGPDVAILSHKLWRRRFGSDREIVGKQIKLDDQSFTVIGVMPEDFENVVAPEAELWAPLQYDTALPPDSKEWGHHLRMLGRLRRGVRIEQATAELDAILRVLGQTYRGYQESGGVPAHFYLLTLQNDIAREVKPALLAVLGAVVVLLVIACVNVTNLLLARGAQRRGEFAMRAALGAAQTRLLRQLITESLVLALLGGAFGLLIARLGTRALILLSPPGLPRLEAMRMDASVFVFALAVTAITGTLVGLLPAWRAARSDPHASLQQISQRTSGGRQWTRRGLVIAEVSLALVLLVSATLLVRSLQRLFSVNAGFDASHVLTMRVQQSGSRYRANEARTAFFRDVLERVRAVPGVQSAGFTSQLPLSGDLDIYGIVFEKDLATTGKPGDDHGFFRYAVTPGYIEAMRIPLVRGRTLQDTDTGDVQRLCVGQQRCSAAPAAVLISQSFARRKFGNDDPIGQRVRLGPAAYWFLTYGQQTPWATIVGVVGDVRQASLAGTPADAIYVANSQWFWGDQQMTLVVRADNPVALISTLRNAVWSVDKDQPIVHIATMEKMVEASEAQRRFVMIIFEVFALVALILAATGIYGVLAGSVSERTREIGVRAALGATRSNILALVVRQGMTMTAIGLVFGVAGAIWASRALITLLFGISPLDLTTYGAVTAMLLGVSLIACSIPAWRAASVDPAITLRAE
jgi:putative ABC transport system permease protein